MAQQYFWGIDLGGTKIEAIVLDASRNFEIVHRQRTPTQADQGYEHVLQNIKKLVDDITENTGIEPVNIGIGTPGSLNPHTERLRNCNSVYLNGHRFKYDVEEVLGIDVKMTNDANCFALSEYKLGIIKKNYPDARVVFGIIMGTGVGSGIVVQGHIVEGKNNIGGEWGHNFLDLSGGPCYCGRKGCVETILSGPALERFYKSKSGHSKSLKEIVCDYREGSDSAANETMERLFYFFPKAVANVINIIDPDVVVLGGGVGNIDELYTKGIGRLNDFVFSDYVETEFTKPLYGDSSGVLGAAMMWA
jgi:fructokinase